MDILRFLEKDKESTKSTGGAKKTSNYLTLSKKEFRGCTFVYKPLLDVNGMPYRRIKNPLELHINTPDEQGNLRWRTFSIYGNPLDYGRLTDNETKLYTEAKQLLTEVGQWSEDPGSPYLTERKLRIIFYAYAIQLLDKNSNDKLPSKGFYIVDHTSAKFTENLHKVRENKSKVMGSGTWINDYFDIEKPNHNIIATTVDASNGIGMDVTIDFMERAPVITVDELKQAQENCGDLNNLGVKASFNPDYFQDIIKVCSSWKKVKLAERSSTPVESNLDKIQTEIASGNVGDTGTPVSPLGQAQNPPPPPSSQMNV